MEETKKELNRKNSKEKKNASPILSSHQKEIEKGLKSIYQDEQGKLPKMNTLEKKNKNIALKLVIGLILVLIVLFGVTLLGFWFFNRTPAFNGERINLELKGPFTTISGEKVKYEIKYTNQEETSLSNAKLIVYFPSGFILDNSSIEPDKKISEENNDSSLNDGNIKTWTINDIFPKQSNTIEIEGKLIGALDSQETVSATLSYFPANFSSEFQKNISFKTEIIDSLLKIEVQSPTQTANLEENEIKISLTNSSSTDLENIELEINYPLEFNLTESKLTENEDTQAINLLADEKDFEEIDKVTQKKWLIASLPASSQKIITIKGNFEVTETQNAELVIKANLKGAFEEYYLQKEEKINFEIIKGELLTNLIIAGSASNQPVNFGDTLNYLLTIQNKSKNTLGDLKVRAVMDSPFLDWASLSDENDGIREGIQILWTKEQIKNLGLLFPEDEVTISFQIKVKDYSQRSKEEDYQINSFFETQINKVDNNETKIISESNNIINDLNTNLSLTATGRYFDNDNQTIGSGPLPPIVGQTTTYKIFYTLSNSLNEIQNVEVKAALPDYVSFAGQEIVSTGSLSANSNNEVVWQISRIPSSINKATAEFAISITPAEEDVHKILTLLPEIKLSATDTQTKGKINITNQGLTTNLEDDPQAEGKGLVQEAE